MADGRLPAVGRCGCDKERRGQEEQRERVEEQGLDLGPTPAADTSSKRKRLRSACMKELFSL